MHQSLGAPPPSLLQGMSGLWGAWDTHTPFLPLQLSSHPLVLTSSQSLPGGVFPSPAEGPPWPAGSDPPISCAAPTPPPLAVESFSQDGRLLLPPRRAKKAQSEWGGERWVLRPPARGEVTWPQSHNRRTRLGQLGTLRNPGGGRICTLPPPAIFPLRVSGATCRRTAGPHVPKTPLSFCPRAKQ